MPTNAPRFDTDGTAVHAAAILARTTGRTATARVQAVAVGMSQSTQELARSHALAADPNHNALIDPNFLETLDVAHA